MLRGRGAGALQRDGLAQRGDLAVEVPALRAQRRDLDENGHPSGAALHRLQELRVGALGLLQLARAAPRDGEAQRRGDVLRINLQHLPPERHRAVFAADGDPRLRGAVQRERGARGVSPSGGDLLREQRVGREVPALREPVADRVERLVVVGVAVEPLDERDQRRVDHRVATGDAITPPARRSPTLLRVTAPHVGPDAGRGVEGADARGTSRGTHRAGLKPCATQG